MPSQGGAAARGLVVGVERKVESFNPFLTLAVTRIPSSALKTANSMRKLVRNCTINIQCEEQNS